MFYFSAQHSFHPIFRAQLVYILITVHAEHGPYFQM